MDVKPENIRTYFDIKIGSDFAGRVVFELYKDLVPKTVENFRALCVGYQRQRRNHDYNSNQLNNQTLSYKGSTIHRITPLFLIQGGRITGENSGVSIYGPQFEDENFSVTHDVEGILGMSNNGRDTNNSEFYITLVPCPHLDGTNVAFGKVIKGFNIIKQMSEEVPRQDDTPTIECKIVNCGELKPEENWFVPENNGTNDVYPPWPTDWDYRDELINQVEETIEKAIVRIKESGDYFFNRKNLQEAIRKYEKAIRYIDWSFTEKLINTKANFVITLKIQCLFSLVKVKTEQTEFKEAVDLCSKILQLDKSNGEVYYRRGLAYSGLKEYKAALSDLQKALKFFPDDEKIIKQQNSVAENFVNFLKSERKMCVRMFK